jgi:hypothetical protein
MSEHIKTVGEIKNTQGEEMNVNEQWVSLSWLEEQINKRRNMFKGLADISELSWVLKLLEMEEKQSMK